MSDKKREVEEEKLLESIQIICHIKCSNCDKKESVEDFDEWLASKHFYDRGWRKKSSRTYCKDCLSRM